MQCPGYQSGHEFIQTRCVELLHSGSKFFTLEKMLSMVMVYIHNLCIILGKPCLLLGGDELHTPSPTTCQILHIQKTYVLPLLQILLLSSHALLSSLMNLVYTLWQEVPKLVYALLTCKPVESLISFEKVIFIAILQKSCLRFVS